MIKFYLNFVKDFYLVLLSWIWQLPQCILGFILTKCYKVEYKEDFKGIPIYAGKFPGGISLGRYILMDEECWKEDRNMIKEHEWGHTRQSLYWSWLYLIGPGLCSVTWVLLRKISKKLRAKSYYSVWPESQADKFGGIPPR